MKKRGSEDGIRLLENFRNLTQWYDALNGDDQAVIDRWIDSGDSPLAAPMLLEYLTGQFQDRVEIAPLIRIQKFPLVRRQFAFA